MIGYLIRQLKIIAHRYDIHYAPVFGPLSGDVKWKYQRWCQWCGFRESYLHDPRAPLTMEQLQTAIKIATERGTIIC